MTLPSALATPLPDPRSAAPAVDVVVPVFDEQADLEPSIRRLHAYLTDRFPFPARITIADNASTDGTWQIACRLAEELPGVRAEHLPAKGSGRALRSAWSSSDATVLAYMDVDLSTDLDALLPLVAPLLSGHSDLAIGTRLARGSRVARGPKRELLSRGYNLVLHAALTTQFSDAQCGFKAIRRDRAQALLPLVQDDGWFFDTELLVLCERTGLRIHEVPVDWVDDPDSRVDLVATALADLGGVVRLGRGLRNGSLGGQAANAVALGATAVANTAANRRWTFEVRGSRGAARHQLQGLLVLGLALALTSGSLAGLHALTRPGRGLELAVLVPAGLAATVLRFVVLRGWVFRRPAPLTAPRAAAWRSR